MSKKQTADLLKFLKPFNKDVIDTVLWLRDFAWDLCPDANELIYDNYNAVAVGWSPTDKLGHTVCSIVAVAGVGAWPLHLAHQQPVESQLQNKKAFH